MRLGISSDNPLDWLALSTGLLPDPPVMGIWGMGYSRCLISAVRLGIFEFLEGGEKSSEEVAAALKCSSSGMDTLLFALSGFKLLRLRRGLFSNSRTAEKWLLKSSKHSMHDALLFYEDIWGRLNTLEDSVRTGSVNRFHEDQLTAEQWKRYIRGLANLAVIPSAEVARRLKLPSGSRRILDVGGGHGLFSAALCHRNSTLHADVLELPQAAVHGREIVKEKGAEHSVSFTEGDMFSASWGEGYDGVLIFNVLHNCSEEQASFVCRKAFDALRPGGVLAILDSRHKLRRSQPQFQGGFNELLFFLISGTRAWPEATIKQWVEDSGFKKIKTRYLLSIPEVFVTAWKQSRPGRGR